LIHTLSISGDEIDKLIKKAKSTHEMIEKAKTEKDILVQIETAKKIGSLIEDLEDYYFTK
jgi:hypothetical protein